MYEANTAKISTFWIFWLITGQNVQKLQILLFFASYIAHILNSLGPKRLHEFPLTGSDLQGLLWLHVGISALLLITGTVTGHNIVGSDWFPDCNPDDGCDLIFIKRTFDLMDWSAPVYIQQDMETKCTLKKDCLLVIVVFQNGDSG